MYKLTNCECVLNTTTSTFIPNDKRNRDWREYEKWLSYGNVPLAADLPLPPVLSRTAIQSTDTESLAYLKSTDWMVLRHVRELALNMTTSLTQAEYIALETKRQAAAKSI
jgi:hypothetical protein